MVTLTDLYNQKSEQEKQNLMRCIARKEEICEMLEPSLRDKGYSEEMITWILTRL